MGMRGMEKKKRWEWEVWRREEDENERYVEEKKMRDRGMEKRRMRIRGMEKRSRWEWEIWRREEDER